MSALALVAAHPSEVITLIAHEPPLWGMLPDTDRAFAAERGVQALFHERGWGHGMAAFIAMTSWQGEFTEGYPAQAPPGPAGTSVATAEALGQEAAVFPSHHGGFTGGNLGHAGEPEAFAARLREVLDDQ